MKKVVLASASPRRKELLERLGLVFDVETSHVDERVDASVDVFEAVKRLALEKAKQIAEERKDALVIAADTVGVLDGDVLGKPQSGDEARRMLAAISGRMHLVVTGLAILDAGSGRSRTDAVGTKVYIKKLSPDEIDAYVRTGEPLDKAGAYAIQGLGALIVERIEGDFYNVVGLPLYALSENLKEFGVDLLKKSG